LSEYCVCVECLVKPICIHPCSERLYQNLFPIDSENDNEDSL
jgi:hypothetical protein